RRRRRCRSAGTPNGGRRRGWTRPPGPPGLRRVRRHPPRLGSGAPRWGAWQRWSSFEFLLVDAVGPFGERLGLGPSVEEAADELLDVVAQVVGGDLEAAHGPAQPCLVAVLRGQSPADVDLEAGHLLAFVVGDDLALETDVGGLDPGAGVRAAVEVEADRVRQIETVQTLLELRDGIGGGLLGLDDREFAVFDAGAGHRRPPEQVLAARQAQGVESGRDRIDVGLLDVEQQDLLVRGGPQPGGPELLGQVDDLAEKRARGAAGDEADADVVAAVDLFVHAHMVAGGQRLLRGGAVGEPVAEVFGLEDLAQ